MHVLASQQLIWGCGKALSSFQKQSLAQGHRAESEEASGRLWSSGNRAGAMGRGKQRKVQIQVAFSLASVTITLCSHDPVDPL